MRCGVTQICSLLNFAMRSDRLGQVAPADPKYTSRRVSAKEKYFPTQPVVRPASSAQTTGKTPHCAIATRIRSSLIIYKRNSRCALCFEDIKDVLQIPKGASLCFRRLCWATGSGRWHATSARHQHHSPRRLLRCVVLCTSMTFSASLGAERVQDVCCSICRGRQH